MMPTTRSRWRRVPAVVLLLAGLAGVGWWLVQDSATGPLPPPRLLLPMQQDGKWGLMDADGRWALPPEYESITLYGTPPITAAGWTEENRPIWRDGEWRADAKSERLTLLIEATRETTASLEYVREWPFIRRRQGGVSAQYLLDAQGRVRLMVVEPAFEMLTEMIDELQLSQVMAPGELIPSTAEPYTRTRHTPFVAHWPVLIANMRAYRVTAERIDALPLTPPESIQVQYHRHESGSLIEWDMETARLLSADGARELTVVDKFDLQSRFLLIRAGTDSHAVAGPDGQPIVKGRAMYRLRHDLVLVSDSESSVVLLQTGVQKQLTIPGVVFRTTGECLLTGEAQLLTPDNKNSARVAAAPGFVAVTEGSQLTIYDASLQVISQLDVLPDAALQFVDDRGTLLVRQAHTDEAMLCTPAGEILAHGRFYLGPGGHLYKTTDSVVCLIDTRGQSLLDMPFMTARVAPFNADWLIVSPIAAPARSGLIDAAGNWLIEPQLVTIIDYRRAEDLGIDHDVAVSQRIADGVVQLIADGVAMDVDSLMPVFDLTIAHRQDGSPWLTFVPPQYQRPYAFVYNSATRTWLDTPKASVVLLPLGLVWIRERQGEIYYLRADGSVLEITETH